MTMTNKKYIIFTSKTMNNYIIPFALGVGLLFMIGSGWLI